MTKSEAITELIEAIKWHDARKHGKSWARVKDAVKALEGMNGQKDQK